jgi:hypothetical protein
VFTFDSGSNGIFWIVWIGTALILLTIRQRQIWLCAYAVKNRKDYDPNQKIICMGCRDSPLQLFHLGPTGPITILK